MNPENPSRASRVAPTDVPESEFEASPVNSTSSPDDSTPSNAGSADSNVAPAAPKVEVAAPPTVSASPTIDAQAQMRRMSRRSFLWAGAATIGTIAGYKWIDSRRLDDGIPWPLRRALDAQSEVSRDLFSPARLAPTFPASRAQMPRVNGMFGLGEGFDFANWTLGVSGLHSGEDLQLTLADIKKLPRTQITTEMKCIEGWSTIVTWAGVRFSDFLKKYPPATQSGEKPDLLKKPTDLLPYVGAQTPDGEYFVGLDMESALHPQTLLCYEMNGKPLTSERGAPLRLVTPTKYGIKHLKRLGTLEFTAQRPQDYWAQRGYDWYSGH